MVLAKLANITRIILRACVLHNLCKEWNDDGEEFFDLEDLNIGHKCMALRTGIHGRGAA